MFDQQINSRAQRQVVPLIVFMFCSSLMFSGCWSKYTYPSNTVSEAVERICQKEYSMQVKARVAGKTIGALVMLDSIMDGKGQVPKDVNEKMGRVLGVLSRVALSTDRALDFCTVVFRDKTGHEMTITRSLDDIKRANAEALGMEESYNRIVFGQGKQKSANEDFVLKEVKLPDFLADQIAFRIQRMHFGFLKDNNEDITNPLILAEGHYYEINGRRVMRFSFFALKSDGSKETILRIFNMVNSVLAGYRFVDYDEIEIQDYLNRQKLTLPKQAVLDYQNKKISEEELLARYLEESATIQEAFKLFNFNTPQDSATSVTTTAPSSP